MANRWNIKTQRLPRPKVCKTSPPEPPKGGTCSVDPEEITGEQGTDIETVVSARKPSLPESSEIQVTLLGNEFITGDLIMLNNGLGRELEVMLDAVPGVYHLTVESEFADDTNCTTPLQVTIEPE